MAETDLGTIVTLSETQRDPKIERRFRIIPGELYGVKIRAMNPMMWVGYEGVLEEITMHVCSRGFDPYSVMLRDGFSYSSDGQKALFDSEIISVRREPSLEFGRVKNEARFRREMNRIIDSIKYQKL